MSELDRARFPRVASYLDTLPAGLASHPACRIGASAYRLFLELKPLGDVPQGALPPAVHELVQAKLPVSSWVDETKVMALLLAIADHHRLADGEFLALNREMNTQLLGGRFFRVLMSLASPSMLMAGAQVRWGALHQGTTLRVTKEGPRSSAATLEFPPFLYNELLLRRLATTFEAALALSNAKGTVVELVASSPERATWRATWS